MQTAAMRYHTQMDCVFVDAPWKSLGPPDDGIAMFYPGRKYFEWFYKDVDSTSLNENETLRQSMQLLVNFFYENGPFDGILGFSQGAAMATRLARSLLSSQQQQRDEKIIKFLVLIGGVTPIEIESGVKSGEFSILEIPSLHIQGFEDPFLDHSKRLETLFADNSTTIIEHQEGHNIPSIRTNVYQKISDFLQSNSA